MVLVDPFGDIVLVNSEIERLFGYRRDELLGQKIEILIPENGGSSIRFTATDSPIRRGRA